MWSRSGPHKGWDYNTAAGEIDTGRGGARVLGKSREVVVDGDGFGLFRYLRPLG